MNSAGLNCAKSDRRAVLYEETDGSIVCGHSLSEAVIDRYLSLYQAFALSLQRAGGMMATNARKTKG